MYLALLFLEFCFHSRISKLSDYKGKTQYITMQKFRFLTICVDGESVRLKKVQFTGS